MLGLLDIAGVWHLIISRTRHSIIIFLEPHGIDIERQIVTASLMSVVDVFCLRLIIKRSRAVEHHLVQLSVISGRSRKSGIELRQMLFVRFWLWID